jgi:hypothetical protein
MYSLAQAAKATGKSKPTIARAIKAGKLSATRAADGSYAIDPAELTRVYPRTGHSAGTMKRSEPGNGADTYPAISSAEVEALHQRIAEQAETIRNLWQRLDAEGEERRRVQERLTGLLTHRQAAGSVPLVQKTETASVARVPWWRRWR